MKKIKSFEFRPGWGSGVETVDNKVNNFILSLHNRGIANVEIKISSTKEVFAYILIWEEPS